MKVKIMNELGQRRDVSIEENTKMEDRLSNEAKQLLLNAGTEERAVLRAAGLDHNIQEIETQRGINIERTTFEGTYGTKVFTEDEVKSICHKYNLRLLQSKLYKGSIDPVLGAKIVEFFKRSGINANNYEATQNLYVMAPPSVFTLTKKTNPLSVDRDPVLFYRITRRNEKPMYAPIHQWGNDFTIFRRIVGAINYSFATNMVFSVACKLSLFMIVLSLFKVDVMSIKPMITGLVMCSAWHIIYYMINYGGSDGTPIKGSRHKFSKFGWDTEFK